MNQSIVSISLGLKPPKNVNNSNVSINMNPNAANSNENALKVAMNPPPNATVNQSIVRITA